jgi:hypothetical protein
LAGLAGVIGSGKAEDETVFDLAPAAGLLNNNKTDFLETHIRVK